MKMTKHTFRLFEGDVEKLQIFYPETGANAIIRTLIHKHVEEIESKARPVPDNLQPGVSI